MPSSDAGNPRGSRTAFALVRLDDALTARHPDPDYATLPPTLWEVALMSSSRALQFLFFALALVAADTATAAEPAGSSDAEKALAARLNCEHFTRNTGHTCTPHANAKIDGRDFGGETFGVHSMMIKDADVATVLNQKCGR